MKKLSISLLLDDNYFVYPDFEKKLIEILDFVTKDKRFKDMCKSVSFMKEEINNA